MTSEDRSDVNDQRDGTSSSGSAHESDSQQNENARSGGSLADSSHDQPNVSPRSGSRTSNDPSIGDGLSETRAMSAATTLIGLRLGDYQVLRKLGRGGMADVYLARQMSLGRDVALKVLRADFARDKDYIARFRREARAAAKLNHPNIVQVFDVGNVDALHYIAQELIDGENLREHLDRHGPLSVSDAVNVLVGVASALEVAADAGITHRDIKPENIMRTHRGLIKVADFGLARLGGDVGTTQSNLTQAGITLGTPRYMSPEQVQGKPVDVRSDLYSLGVTMYHLLAGRPPFEADEPMAMAYKHLHETPEPLDRVRHRVDADGNPDLPEWLVAVITRLMAKLPQDRFQSPTDLLDAIRRETAVPAVGDAAWQASAEAATIRLQRATDQARRRRRQRQIKWAVAVLIPLVATYAAWRWAQQQPGPTVAEILRPDAVDQKATVQEQYLNAVQRDDEAGWRSVGLYFPPTENGTNAAYYAKSMLQLARMYAEEESWEQADQTLEKLLQDPAVDRVYQALALARRAQVLESMGRRAAANRSRREFQTLYSELESTNPDFTRLIDRVLSDEDRSQLGVVDS